MPEETKPVRGKPFEKGNTYGRRKVTVDSDEEILRALRRKAKRGFVSAAKEYLDRTRGKAMPGNKQVGPQISEETAKRMVAIAEKLVTNSVSLTLTYAKDILWFLDLSPRERGPLSATALYALRVAVEETERRLAAQPPQGILS